jgi:hypothetical protein
MDAKKRGERETRRERMQRLVRLPFREFTSRTWMKRARSSASSAGACVAGSPGARARPPRPARLPRTIRAAIPTGGTPVRPRWRTRRPGRPDLVALCDLSGSGRGRERAAPRARRAGVGLLPADAPLRLRRPALSGVDRGRARRPRRAARPPRPLRTSAACCSTSGRASAPRSPGRRSS